MPSETVTTTPPPPPAARSSRRFLWLLIGVLVVAGAGIGVYLWRQSLPKVAPPPTPEIQAMLDQIQELYNHQKYPEALQQTRAFLSANPKAPYLHFTAGTILATMKQFQEAIQEFEAEIKVNPYHVRSYNSIGIAFSALGQFEKSIPYAEKSLAIKPDQPIVALALGHRMADQGKDAEAEKLLLRAIPAKLPEAHYQLAMLYLRRGDRPKAVEQFRATLAIDNKHLAALYNLAQTLKRLGRSEEAETILARHVKLATEYDQLEQWLLLTESADAKAKEFTLVGDAYVREKEYDSAITNYKRAIALEPNEPRHLQALAAVYSEKGDLDQASQIISKVMELRPNSSSGMFLLGTIRLRQKNLPEAQRLLALSKQMGDWSPQTYRQLGMACFAAGLYQEAVDAYRQAIVLDPKSAEAYYWLGVCYFAMGDLDSCQQFAQEAARLDPANDEYAMGLAIARFRAGNRDGAEEAFRTAIRLQRATLFSPENVDAMLARYGNGKEVAPAIAFYRELRTRIDAEDAAKAPPEAQASAAKPEATHTP